MSSMFFSVGKENYIRKHVDIPTIHSRTLAFSPPKMWKFKREILQLKTSLFLFIQHIRPENAV